MTPKKHLTSIGVVFAALLICISLNSCGEATADADSKAEVGKAAHSDALPATQTTNTRTPEAILDSLGLELPVISAPVANYVNAVRTGNLIFLAGKGPRKADGTYITGKVGEDLTVEEGYEAARIVALNQLAVLKAELGELSRIKRVVKVLGMVNCSPDFGNQPEVVNGFSDLLVEVLGERGKHARAAVGMGSLPRGIAVEVELVVEVE
ncbi:Enamine deaminase RidA, house cleaning of reactive enamine intermediates, YjgF/YER057c/UK114 family [Robiginitalea myxolifaciens]|uniref:Enamine deaminase RidA, house cleaning of reactive enamine intermediates, YjgF/YER057c/UK114 family n=1 Tax=Robiginitalea myxolifaciens TaxID=400055 RepID=A0A1I6FY39_9FLAO|nr:RidA family protein [Robiginitalea myxolifaciens]SFR34824.1 Enamine deaminase RidA, house cleaning of reactive enamine intermediates, YjgF/YER057c/UK114 family [Robiginitalea myxolifaciens]